MLTLAILMIMINERLFRGKRKREAKEEYESRMRSARHLFEKEMYHVVDGYFLRKNIVMHTCRDSEVLESTKQHPKGTKVVYLDDTYYTIKKDDKGEIEIGHF